MQQAHPFNLWVVHRRQGLSLAHSRMRSNRMLYMAEDLEAQSRPLDVPLSIARPSNSKIQELISDAALTAKLPTPTKVI